MDETMQPFDLCQVSLEPATTLIEASAGTGKTYSIAGLLIRLLLEQDIAISQVVAVTFTEAATKELRERVRGRLAAALHDLRTGNSDDPVVQSFVSRGGNVVAGVNRLNLALKSFDEAQIFTIHGFCQRCLSDYTFESGAQFDTTLSADATPLFEEIAHDFWRRQFHGHNELLAAVAIAWDQSPAQWVKLLQLAARHPDKAILPPLGKSSLPELVLRLEHTFAAVRAEWQQQRAQIKQILLANSSLSRAKTSSFHPDNVADLLSQLTLACERFDCSAPACLGALAEVCSDAIAAGTTAKGVPPTHRFFDLCGDFCRAVTALCHGLTRELLDFARDELPKRKARANTVTYDDLILDLRAALRGPRGARLAGLIGQRYRAALIDEFQDTDPAQYEIFRTIFGTGQHSLFYIGDPKQAIYGFRGADIFTYRQAAQAARQHAYTLTTNWRSEPGLLRALNALFQQADRPFVFDWIDYHAVHAPAKPRVLPLRTAADISSASLRLRLITAPESGKGFNQDDATPLVCNQLTSDILGLLADEVSLGDRPLRFSNLAVLVRKNGQAETIQESLRQAGIRSVLRTESNVFATPEAEELERLLQGVLDPRRESALKGALATDLLGLNATELYELQTDEVKRLEWLERFLDWQDQWVNGCFAAMFRRLLVEQSVRARLVKLPAGERRLTNYLQMAELLHEAETARHLAPDAVRAFLSEQLANPRVSQENYQLRLESDEDAVHIVTVHKAKGLEYPIVFCPFLWQPAESKNRTELLFHDREQDDRLTFDLREKKRGEQKHQDWLSEETRAEELRLAYVALTRAMNQCYVYLPDVKRILESPLAHLLAANKKHSVAGQVELVVASGGGSIEAVAAQGFRPAPAEPAPTAPPHLEARKLANHISHVALSASFTGLNTEVELDRDAVVNAEEEPPAAGAHPANGEPTIFTFPRGAAAGDFFHEVLEEVDLARPETRAALIATKMRLHGFANPALAPVIDTTVRTLLDLELAPGVRLGAASPSEMLRELDFTYPLKHLTPARFREILAHCPDLDGAVSGRMGRLQFRPVEGFMRGFVDVLFRSGGRYYIIDWKSNWLGSRGADYQLPQIRAEMLRSNYYLQYHLYTLAVDLFLRRRLPHYDYERDFGGVFYVFLRGVDLKQPRQGVFHDRPSARTLAALHELLP